MNPTDTQQTEFLPTQQNLLPLKQTPNESKKTPIYGGNWTRTKYDQGSFTRDTQQATYRINYMLDPNYAEQCKQCRPLDWIGKQGVSYNNTQPMIDTESDLLNLNRILTRDPNYKYAPNCTNCEDCPEGYPCGAGATNSCKNCQPSLHHFPICDIKHEYTRTSNPSATLKETGVNRFDPICLNPQDRSRWEHPGATGINYRLVVKDNHIPCIPHPIDQTPALPKGGDLPCELTIPTCSAHIAPMHNYYNQ